MIHVPNLMIWWVLVLLALLWFIGMATGLLVRPKPLEPAINYFVEELRAAQSQ